MTPEEEKLNNMIVKLTAYAPTQPDMLVCARILDLCDAAQALQSENARLRKVVEQCKELSGRKMDYGSDSDAIQGIYILTYNALNSKPESGV